MNLIYNIDDSKEPWVKIAFYSDNDVSEVLEKAYERWMRAGCNGEPLNYVTDDELEILYVKTRNTATPSLILGGMLMKAIYGYVRKEKRILNPLKPFLRLFLPVR
ncbi:MAG: hypothetical protein QXZ10_02105 [Sulfolobales archaeon]